MGLLYLYVSRGNGLQGAQLLRVAGLGSCMVAHKVWGGYKQAGQLHSLNRPIEIAQNSLALLLFPCHRCCRLWPGHRLCAWYVGVPATPTQEDDLFKDPGWQDPVLSAFGAGPGLPGPSQAAQQSMSGHHGMGASMGGRPPAARPLGDAPGTGLDDIFGFPASKPASLGSGGPLPPRLAPPPPGSHPVQYSPAKMGQAQHSRKASLSSQQDSLI